MLMYRRWGLIPIVLLLIASSANAQGSTVTPAQAAPFMGTWVFTMTEPPHFKGSMQTVRIWDQDGRVAASVQVGKFPENNVTGMYRDSDMLVLTISLYAASPIRENGVALRAVIMLTPDGDGMRMAQMLDASETIKRGIGKKQGC
jgi:hypothetical protein